MELLYYIVIVVKINIDTITFTHPWTLWPYNDSYCPYCAVLYLFVLFRPLSFPSLFCVTEGLTAAGCLWLDLVNRRHWWEIGGRKDGRGLGTSLSFLHGSGHVSLMTSVLMGHFPSDDLDSLLQKPVLFPLSLRVVASFCWPSLSFLIFVFQSYHHKGN